MGTRADFYVGRGAEAEWLGSIAWDGHPEGVDDAILAATDEQGYRDAVASFFDRDDVTLPEAGWPWPWDDSRTTDYAYAFEAGDVRASCFGHAWFDPELPEPEDEGAKVAVFPDMSARKNVRFDKGSGVIIISGGAQ